VIVMSAEHTSITCPDVDVLIVDDDEETRDSFRAVLEEAGYSVATACNGREAIDMLPTIRPALILLDVCMPVMDGASFRQEQRHHWDWLHIPTIVMTGANEETMLDLAVEETLRKPLSAEDLRTIVARHRPCGSRRSRPT
jgi:two-component system cell cycle response regulator DivK